MNKGGFSLKSVFFIFMLVCLFFGTVDVNAVSKSAENETITKNVSSSDDLQQYYNKTELDFEPNYRTMNLNKELKKGDIIFERNAGLGLTHHVAIVVDTLYSSKYDINYVKIIESIPGDGVCYSLIDETRFIRKDDTILRLKENLSESDINKLMYFLEKQVGKSYSYVYTEAPTDINTEKWYCSSLVYACYNYIGIDLYPGNWSTITPGDILASEKLMKVNTTAHLCEFNRCTRLDRYYHDHHCAYCGLITRNSHFFIKRFNYKECLDCGYRIYEGGIEQLCYSNKLVNY